MGAELPMAANDTAMTNRDAGQRLAPAPGYILPSPQGNVSGAGAPQTFRTVVADPPWEIKAGPRSLHDAHEKSRELKYPTLNKYEIAALPVRRMAAKDAHLYLWTINAYVEDAYWIARAWGFEPRTLLVWVKAPKGRGLGGTFSTATEYVLFARRGSLGANNRVERNWWEWKRGAHSEKPEAFIDLVESISPGPYLELFARRNRLGWATWGNECFNHIGAVAPATEEYNTGDQRPMAAK